ncbi:MAG: PTS sugar transporter subunit IIA [Deltaproteobacteria bacterium]|jgi:mannitol/fructose-specific phosphotransferase system IIA component (Ntr-type)|nr:PTS sugar transporter subunit IIA [Deltaproteobacteria bacterium]
MLISDYLNQSCIDVNLKPTNKNDIITQLADLVFQAYPEIVPEEAMEGLSERESVMSTGIGEGIAIPHARIESCREIRIAIGLLREGVDFNAIDNQPVRFVILIFFPKEEVTLQLQTLAKVSRILKKKSLNEHLLNATSSTDILEYIKQYEKEQCF